MLTEQIATSERVDHQLSIRREWLAAFLVALGATMILTIPYLLGYILARQGTSFSGVIMNPEDSQSYFAKMLQGFEGRWLYTIPFTTEQHDPAFLGGFYLALGHVARWLRISIDGVWHFARIVADLFLFMATFGFIAIFLNDRRTRWIAYLLAVFSSGLGWLLFLLQEPYWLGAFPVDFKMPEAHLFFSALTFPHVAIGTGLVLVSNWLLVKAATGKLNRWRFAVLAGFSNLAIGIVYPFLIYLVALTAFLYWLFLAIRARRIQWDLTALFGICFIIPLPLYLYYANTYQVNDVFRAWAAQAITTSPPWPHYLIAYGPLLLLAILPIVARKARLSYLDRLAFLWIWFLAAAILAYAPLNPQRRFVQGVQVPLSILAAVGLVEVAFPRLARSRIFQRVVAHPRYTEAGLQRLIVTGLIMFLSLSNIYVLTDVSLTAALRQPYPFFREDSEIEAVEWLRENTEQAAVVLGAYESGNYIAGRAGNRVVVGHWAETVDWQAKYDMTTRFFTAMTDDDWRRAYIVEQNVEYVWYGPKEQTLGDFDPDAADYLRLVFTSNGTSIYEASSSSY